MRIELRLERKRVKLLTKCNEWEEQLQELLQNQNKIMGKFMCLLHQNFPIFIIKEQAIQKIESSDYQTRTKKKMIKIVKKTSDCASLVSAKKKLGLSNKTFMSLLRKFHMIGISPVTLPNNSPVDKLIANG